MTRDTLENYIKGVVRAAATTRHLDVDAEIIIVSRAMEKRKFNLQHTVNDAAMDVINRLFVEEYIHHYPHKTGNKRKDKEVNARWK